MSNTSSVADGYAEWLGAKPFSWSSDTPPTETGLHEVGQKPTQVYVATPKPRPTETVGIVGAGMSGLYAGLLLKGHNIPFRIFEASKTRIGGRVYTCREGFVQEGNYQYFEAGAMRIPCIPSQKPLFELIEHLNSTTIPGEKPHLNLIDYQYKYDKGNLVYVNGNLMTLEQANQNPANLGFSGLNPEDKNMTADSLMDEVMKPLLDEFQNSKAAGQCGLDKFFKKYDQMSLRYYLGSYESGPKWYPAKIDYVETMTSGSNAFTYGLVESIIEYDDFNGTSNKWRTIDKGMSRLPEACAAVIGKQNITLGAIVYKITKQSDGKIELTYTTDGQIPSESPKTETFDKVLITVPNAVLRMIERPRWSSIKEGAIRVCNMQPTYKLGLQFETRFWECNSKVTPTYGGQSTTDTPSRWIVYPSYDLKSKGKGILLTYSWSTDALSVLPASDKQRKDIALRDLKEMYPHVDVYGQFINCKSVHWSAEWGTGVADFLPGQFSQLFPALMKNEGNIYFAGEHISMRHGWIVGGLDSAGRACKQMFPHLVWALPK